MYASDDTKRIKSRFYWWQTESITRAGALVLWSCDFKSQHQILNGCLFTLICCKFCLLEKTESKSVNKATKMRKWKANHLYKQDDCKLPLGWWCSSGQRVCLPLQWSVFESRWRLQYLMCNSCLKRRKKMSDK